MGVFPQSPQIIAHISVSPYFLFQLSFTASIDQYWLQLLTVYAIVSKNIDRYIGQVRKMGKMVVTFCGHREVDPQDQVAEKLEAVIESLIAAGAEQFLLGGYGQFDWLAARAVNRAKMFHPGIESILVIPYLDRNYDDALYDRTLYPSLEQVPRRFAISRRNKYMVDAADVIVAYVIYDWGGAAGTLEYAKRRRKYIIYL